MTYTEIENAINEGLENDRKEYRVKFDKVLKDGRTYDVFRLKNESRIEPIYYIRNDLTEGFIYGDLVKELDLAYNTIPEMPSFSKEFILKNIHKGVAPMNRGDEFEKANVYCFAMYDLLVYYYIDLGVTNTGSSIIKLTNGLMKQYEIEFEELDYAADNQEANIEDMTDFFKMMNLDIYELPENAPKMLIISNKERCRGAGEIMSVITRRKIYHMLGDKPYYILPSSIHEVIVVPSSIGDVNDLKTMVKEVNKTLNEEDILSNKVYKCTQNLHFDVAI